MLWPLVSSVWIIVFRPSIQPVVVRNIRHGIFVVSIVDLITSATSILTIRLEGAGNCRCVGQWWRCHRDAWRVVHVACFERDEVWGRRRRLEVAMFDDQWLILVRHDGDLKVVFFERCRGRVLTRNTLQQFPKVRRKVQRRMPVMTFVDFLSLSLLFLSRAVAYRSSCAIRSQL